jgi:ADP-ribose pyrophosphatase
VNSESDHRIIASGRFLRLVNREGWEFVERANATGVVAIVAVTDNGRLLLTEQYREPVRCRVADLPAGLAGDVAGEQDEDFAAAAQRELQEEVGYAAESMRYLFRGPSSAGLTSEVITFYRAGGLRRVGPGGGDASEDIQVHEVPLDEFDDWVAAALQRGVTIDPKVLAGLYFAGYVYREPPNETSRGADPEPRAR